MRRFRAPSLPDAGGVVVLDESSSHHLLRVLGVARGEDVELFDGAGRRALAALTHTAEGRAVLLAQAPSAPDLRPDRWLLPSLVKHEAFDLILRMATELGATHILPLLAARSVARGDRQERWQRILESAAAQCGRADLPRLFGAQALSDALAELPEGLSRRVYTPGGPALPPPPGSCALLLGPEGGFTDAEVQLALESGFEAEGLGPNVLRADTAAAAALSRLL